MTDERRRRLFNGIALAVVIITHLGVLAGLAMMSEWRVWRLMANFVAQLDAVIILLWLVCRSLTVQREWPLAARLNRRTPSQIDYTDPRKRFNMVLARLMAVLVTFIVVGIVALPLDSIDESYVLAIVAVGFFGIAIAHFGRAWLTNADLGCGELSTGGSQ